MNPMFAYQTQRIVEAEHRAHQARARVGEASSATSSISSVLPLVVIGGLVLIGAYYMSAPSTERR